MNWFKNLKTGAKLLVGFGGMTVALATIIVIAYGAITSIRDSQRQLFEREFTGVVGMSKLRTDLNRQRASALAMMLTINRGEQEALRKDIAIRVGVIDESLQTLIALYRDNATVTRKLDDLKDMLVVFRQARDAQIKLIFDGKIDEAKRSVAGAQAERFDKIQATSLELGNDLLEHARTRIAESGALAARSVRLFALFGTLALLVGVVMTALLTRLIARPLVDIASVAERMASGDLTVNVASNAGTDEVGVLIRNFGKMAESLRDQLRGLAEGANVLGASASEIVASTVQLAASASESAVAVSETTTTVVEVRQAAEVASQKAKLLSDSAQRATQSSLSGRKSTEDVAAGMQRIRQQMDAIAVSMGRLSEQSQAIGQIVATVEDLAAQSNLLAVNAAIKAAEAGEHGKGFGVVALEVRSLAEQSRQATSQVRTLLGEIQKATSAAVLATEQGSKAVEAGSRQTEVAGESIQALAASVNESAQAATQIAASSQQQLVGVDQVVGAMESIKQASSQNVASAQQLETAARSLNDLGQRLKQMVQRYKLESGGAA